MSQENKNDERKADLNKAIVAYEGAIATFERKGIENLKPGELKAYHAAVNRLRLAREELNQINSAS